MITRTIRQLAVGLGAAVPLVLFSAPTASAYSHPMMPGASVQSGPDTSGMFIQISGSNMPYRCEVTFDTNAAPTVGGDADPHGLLNFNNLPALENGYHVAHITCHTGKSFETDWNLPDQPVPGATAAQPSGTGAANRNNPPAANPSAPADQPSNSGSANNPPAPDSGPWLPWVVFPGDPLASMDYWGSVP